MSRSSRRWRNNKSWNPNGYPPSEHNAAVAERKMLRKLAPLFVDWLALMTAAAREASKSFKAINERLAGIDFSYQSAHVAPRARFNPYPFGVTDEPQSEPLDISAGELRQVAHFGLLGGYRVIDAFEREAVIEQVIESENLS